MALRLRTFFLSENVEGWFENKVFENEEKVQGVVVLCSAGSLNKGTKSNDSARVFDTEWWYMVLNKIFFPPKEKEDEDEVVADCGRDSRLMGNCCAVERC